jgi:hypothetical protein
MYEKLVVNSISCAVQVIRTGRCSKGFDQPQLQAMNIMFHNRTRKGLSARVSQARSSVGERFLDTEEVGSSILPVPTILR